MVATRRVVMFEIENDPNLYWLQIEYSDGVEEPYRELTFEELILVIRYRTWRAHYRPFTSITVKIEA
jgi:hypothetical protein